MTDLKKLAIKLATDGPVRTLPIARQIRLLFNGQYIVTTTRAVYVWEHAYYPQIYLHEGDILKPASQTGTTTGSTPSPSLTKGETITDPSSSSAPLATLWSLALVSRSIDNKILSFASPQPHPAAAPLAGLVRVDFASVDQWFEEDAPIFVHPKDPFKRIDVLPSSRRVRVKVGGRLVADAAHSSHLHETGLPTRYYLPFSAIVDPGVLVPSERRSVCPYKGEAEYYSVRVDGKVHEDVVWYYTRPLLESAKIEGLLCFYNEKVEIELDGEAQEVPVTHFTNSRGPPSAV